MYPRNAILSQWGSFLTSFRHCISYHRILFIVSFFLLISLGLFAKKGYNLIDSAKVNSSFLNAVNSPATGVESIRSSLYLLNADNSTLLVDQVLAEYNISYHDSVYLEDAYKFTNITENLGIVRYGTVLSIERRPIIFLSDTLFFKLWRTTIRNYQFEFVTNNLDHLGMQAFLEDAYLATSTMVSLTGSSRINFSITSDPLSSNVNRFRIVYKTNLGVLPVTFSNCQGYQTNKKNTISWQVENEIDIEEYEIERSGNGIDFAKVFSIVVNGNTKGLYKWVDENTVNAESFYRIKIVSRGGLKTSGKIIKIILPNSNIASVAIYPNPVKNNLINLQLTNQLTGIYQIRLINNSGLLLHNSIMNVSGNDIILHLFINEKLVKGFYHLEIVGPDKKVNWQKLIVE